MLYSKMLMPTFKEVPADCDNISQALMIRGSMLKKAGNGLFVYLPYFNMLLENVKNEIRRGMAKANSNECKFPILVSKEDLIESGRWEAFGKEMFRLVDRNDKEFALSPTNEEASCFVAEAFVKSYQDLPLSIYQIQQKHRDEIRPHGGVLRAREFIMKDAYSFHESADDLDNYYNDMRSIYIEIFNNLGLKVVSVKADSGAMGGSGSEEIMALSQTGESSIAYCNCNFVANSETIEIKQKQVAKSLTSGKFEKIHTPNSATIEELTNFLKIAPTQFVKTMLYSVNESLVAVLVRGDREVNEVKLNNYFKGEKVELASFDSIAKKTNSILGFVGAVGLTGVSEVLADFEVLELENFIVGANEKNYHLKNVNIGDINAKGVDLRFADENDACPICGNKLTFSKANELGHIFKLGTRYTNKLNLTYIASDGKPKIMVMGCYGIGLERTASAIIEQHHDDKGMVLPMQIAPFKVNVIAVDITNEKQKSISEQIYFNLLDKGVSVLFDDRKARAGVKFNDSDLLGIPIKIIVGKNVEEGKVELGLRTGEKSLVEIDEVVNSVLEIISDTILQNKGLYENK